ncbi:MAG: hypothetical protein R3F55_18540 [Alphaproteobacteria bacterium]
MRYVLVLAALVLALAGMQLLGPAATAGCVERTGMAAAYDVSGLARSRWSAMPPDVQAAIDRDIGSGALRCAAVAAGR